MMRLADLRRRFFQNAIDPARPIASLARWPRWLVACAVGRPVIARFATGGLRMRLKPRLSSFGSTSIYIKRDHYEPELLAVGRLVRPGSVVLDIGGSFGVFSLFLAHFVGANGRVHAFEPGGFSFEQLSANVAMNAAGSRIVLHRMAASDREAVLRLFHIGGSPVNFSVGEDGEGGFEEVRAGRIDSVVPPADWPRVSFVKIDVEGYEQAALEGARAILEASRPAIMFEVSGSALARQSMTPCDIYDYLAGYGYAFWVLDGDRFVAVDGHPEGNIFASVRPLG